jgi:tetratricopeptide (TPR) repeat protein
VGAFLFCVIVIAYLPALNGGFVWDDNNHVTRPELRSLHGLWRIWFDLGATQQYYPLLHSAFWAEHRLWGDAVLGYHLTNLVLHAVAGCLIVLILRRLSLPGAWLAAFVFALHPVSVESVAWITEQKNTLSTVFYLGSALAYLRFDRTRLRLQYFLALGLFVLALLSKTVAATLPAALLVVFWWMRGRLRWRSDVLPLLPWFALGASAGLFSAWIERRFIGAEGPEFALTLVERCLIAGRAIWFYLGKLVWPVDLMFVYPRWTVDSGAWWQYLYPLGVVALAVGLLFLSRQWRGPLAGFLFFSGTLFPALGFLNVYPFVNSYVGDHYQYAASLGIIVPLASGLVLASRRIPFAHRRVGLASAGLLMAVLGTLTWRQTATYRDSQTLYRETLARNPASWLAHNNLGGELIGVPGGLDEAIDHFEAALRIKPDLADAQYNLGLALSRIPGRLPEAIAHYEAALKLRPDYPDSHNNLGNALSGTPGRLPEAIAHYEAALRSRPDYADAHNNLAAALSKIEGRLPEAIAHYEAALRINPDSAEMHYNLGNALLKVPGRLPDAISEYEAALRIRPDMAQARQMLDRLGATH